MYVAGEYDCGDEEIGQYMIYWSKTKAGISRFINDCIFSLSLENSTWYEFVIRLN